MALPRVKSTYSLDLETIELLDRMAKRWRVSKSEALRRAVRTAAVEAAADAGDALDALHALQGSLRLTPTKTAVWARRSHAERRRSSARSETRGK